MALQKTQSKNDGQPGIKLRDISKVYETAAGPFNALQAINLDIEPGEFVAVVGKSGSGKSTLLNLLGGIDRPTSGEVIVGDTGIHSLSENQMAVWRGRNVGVVFQFFQLLPTLTILENVILPMDFCGYIPQRERLDKARQLLELVGVADQADKLPASLSGGQQQRAAIARALANDPPILLADEPTGNLDSQNAAQIWQLFKMLAGKGKTVLVVTHERDISEYINRTIRLADGVIVNGHSQSQEVINAIH